MNLKNLEEDLEEDFEDEYDEIDPGFTGLL